MRKTTWIAQHPGKETNNLKNPHRYENILKLYTISVEREVNSTFNNTEMQTH
jgi:hypothetical protein